MSWGLDTVRQGSGGTEYIPSQMTGLQPDKEFI